MKNKKLTIKISIVKVKVPFPSDCDGWIQK